MTENQKIYLWAFIIGIPLGVLLCLGTLWALFYFEVFSIGGGVSLGA